MGKQSALPPIPVLLQHNPLGKGMLPCGAVKRGSFLGPRRAASPTGEASIALPASARAEPRPSTLLSPDQAVSSSSGSVCPIQSVEELGACRLWRAQVKCSQVVPNPSWGGPCRVEKPAVIPWPPWSCLGWESGFVRVVADHRGLGRRSPRAAWTGSGGSCWLWICCPTEDRVSSPVLQFGCENLP